jgi:hypothetical protein
VAKGSIGGQMVQSTRVNGKTPSETGEVRISMRTGNSMTASGLPIRDTEEESTHCK